MLTKAVWRTFLAKVTQLGVAFFYIIFFNKISNFGILRSKKSVSCDQNGSKMKIEQNKVEI